MVFDTSCRSFPKLKSGPLCGPIAGKPAPTSYSAHLIPVLSLWGGVPAMALVQAMALAIQQEAPELPDHNRTDVAQWKNEAGLH